MLYRRNRYYDPAAGRFTQEDPIGLAGGLNLYGFAGGDPVNYSDPFGLCPRCNMHTGDRNLDNPESRDRMEDSYDKAPTDSGGYRVEQGGSCSDTGACEEGSQATRDHIRIRVDKHTKYDWHTHGNVGKAKETGTIFQDMYVRGPSEDDISGAGLAFQVGFKSPSYIIDDSFIYRLTAGKNNEVKIDFFQRWEQHP